MSIKFVRVDPTPIPLPPPTFSITGLSKREAKWLRNVLIHRSPTRVESEDEKNFMRRIIAVIVGVETSEQL